MMRCEVLGNIHAEEVRRIHDQSLGAILQFVDIGVNAEVGYEYVSDENGVSGSNNCLRIHSCVVVKDHLCKFMLRHASPNGSKWDTSLFESGKCRVNMKPIKAP